MSVIQIRKAQREGARVVIGLAGLSGGGKTYTALQLAYGMANYRAEKVGVLDTENRRGSLYSDALQRATKPTDEPFLIGDLFSPFSPQRYIEAIHEFQQAGIEVLVIDSVTHEWEGNGGCEDIAERQQRGGMKDWASAKREHKRFMSALLQSDMHIVACIRAREKVEILKEKNPQSGKIETVVRPLGIMPVQEKNFCFELTAGLMVLDEGKSQQVMKCPAELRGILGRQTDYITADDGKAVRDWLDGARKLDPAVEKFRNRLQSVTEQGAAYVTEAWGKTPQKIRDALGEPFRVQLVKSAEAFDKGRADSKPGGADLADLNNQVLAGADGAAAQAGAQ